MTAYGMWENLDGVDAPRSELMRIYSNELDRTNALIIAHGFSFEDEHVLSITKRAL